MRLFSHSLAISHAISHHFLFFSLFPSLFLTISSFFSLFSSPTPAIFRTNFSLHSYFPIIRPFVVAKSPILPQLFMKRISSQLFSRLFLTSHSKKPPSTSSSSDLGVSEVIGPGDIPLLTRRHSVSFPCDETTENSLGNITDTIDPFDNNHCLKRSKSLLLGFSLKRKSLSLLRLTSAKSVRFNDKNDTQWFQVELEEEPEAEDDENSNASETGSDETDSDPESDENEKEALHKTTFRVSNQRKALLESFNGSLPEEDPKKLFETPGDVVAEIISPAKSFASSNYQSADDNTPKLAYDNMEEYRAAENNFQRSFSEIINSGVEMEDSEKWLDGGSVAGSEEEKAETIKGSSKETKTTKYPSKETGLVEDSIKGTGSIKDSFKGANFSAGPLFDARVEEEEDDDTEKDALVPYSTFRKGLSSDDFEDGRSTSRLQRELDATVQKLNMALELNTALSSDLKASHIENEKQNEELLDLKREIGALSVSLAKREEKEAHLRSSVSDALGNYHKEGLSVDESTRQVVKDLVAKNKLIEELSEEKRLVDELSEQNSEMAFLLQKAEFLQLENNHQKEIIVQKEEIIALITAGLDVSLEDLDFLKEESQCKERGYQKLIQDKNKELGCLDARIRMLKGQVSDAKKEVAKKDDIISNMGFQVLDLESDVAEMAADQMQSKKVHEKEVSRFEQVIGDLRSQLSVLENSNVDLFAILRETEKGRDGLREEKETAAKKCVLLELSLNEKEKVLEGVKKEVQKLQQMALDHKEIGSLKAEIEGLKKRDQLLILQIASLKAELSTAASSLEAEEEKSHLLEERTTELADKAQYLETLLENQTRVLELESVKCKRAATSLLVLLRHFRRLVKGSFESLSPILHDESKEEFSQLYYRFTRIEYFEERNSVLIAHICGFLVVGASDFVEKYMKMELMLQYEYDNKQNYYQSMLKQYAKVVESAMLRDQGSSRK